MRINIYKTIAILAVLNLTATAFANDADQAQQQSQQGNGQQIQESAGAQPQEMKAKMFLKQAAVENKMEIALSQLAEQKAQNPQIKQFAQKLGDSHEQSSQELQQLAQQKGIPADLQQFQQMVTASGQQFDRQYLHYITKEGREGLQHMENVANQHPDPSIQQFARQQLQGMRQHLQQAQRAQTEIQASGQLQEPAGAQPQQESAPGQQGAQIREGAGAPSGQQGVDVKLQQLEQQVQQLQEQVQQLQSRQQSGQQAGEQPMPDARQFVKIAAAYCKMGTVLNALATQKATSPQVKQLVQQQKQSMQQNGQQLRDLAQQHGIQVDPQQLQQLADIRDREFDKVYIRFVTERHREALQDLERISNEAQDPQVKEYARQQIPVMRQHLEEAQRLQTQIQAGDGIQEPAGAERPENEQNQELPKN